MVIVPVGVKIHRHDAGNLSGAGKYRAVGAVKNAPGILVSLLIHAADALKGSHQRRRRDDRIIKGTGVVRRIKPEDVLPVSPVINAVNEFQLNIVVECAQGLHAFFEFRRSDVFFRHIGQSVTVHHRGGRVRNIKHPFDNQSTHRVTGLGRKKKADDSCDKNDNSRQDDNRGHRQAETVFLPQHLFHFRYYSGFI